MQNIFCSSLLFAVMTLQCLYLTAQNTAITRQLRFDINQSELSPATVIHLQNWIDSLNTAGTIERVSVIAHTDNAGSDQFNEQLSQQRMQKTMQLLQRYVTDVSIDGIFMGERSPVASNKNREGRQLNRRVEITVFLKTRGTVGEEQSGDLRELYELVKSKPDVFCIDLTKDTFVVGSQGTIISYQANSIRPLPNPGSCFTLTLEEYYKNADLLLNNLTTTSGSINLESGGMIRMQGFVDGRIYSLQPGEGFTVMVPTDTVMPGMRLWSGIRDNIADLVDWKADDHGTIGNSVREALDTFSYDRMYLHCARGTGGTSGHCRLFFCRIGYFLERTFRKKQTKLKQRDQKNNEQAEKEEALLRKYALDPSRLKDALESSRENAGKQVLKYFVYRNMSWDYRNCDRYFPGDRFTDFIVNRKPVIDEDVKMVFKTTRAVIPAFEKTAHYKFISVDDNQPVWIVGIRYNAAGEIGLALKSSNTSVKRESLEFKNVTIDEFRMTLQQVNRR